MTSLSPRRLRSVARWRCRESGRFQLPWELRGGGRSPHAPIRADARPRVGRASRSAVLSPPGAPSDKHEQVGARILPQPVSHDRRRIRRAVSGESSARAAAVRIRARFVEEAEAVQTSEELKAMATKLTQLFPARRAMRVNANANSRRVVAGRPHTGRSSATARPEQPSDSQVGAPLHSRQG